MNLVLDQTNPFLNNKSFAKLLLLKQIDKL
jgi:hypothetical protein